MERVKIKSLIVIILLIFTVSCIAKPTDSVFEEYDPANFMESTTIDNQWMPLIPGTQWIFEGYSIENDKQLPHRVIITVTDLVKVIDNVRSVVTWDLDYSAGQLVEAELAFFAQDKDGNVWRMGEYPEEYKEGKFVEAPAWIHGFDYALAGIAMLAEPKPDTPDYPQGWAPNEDWTDRGRVDKVSQQLCVPFNCYENVLVIAETSKSEPDAVQLKYYASGIGNVSVDWTGADQTQETMQLVKMSQLDPVALADARASALKLEEHAYKVRKDVYGKTQPLIIP